MASYRDEENDVGEGGYNAEPFGGDGIRAFVPEDEVVDALDVEVLLTDEEEELIAREKLRRIVLILVCVFVAIAAIIIPVSVTLTNDGTPTPNPTSSPTERPTSSPTAAPTATITAVIAGCLNNITSKETFDKRAAQWKAVSWITTEDSYVEEEDLPCSSKRYHERYALATLYFAMNGTSWQKCGQSDPDCSMNGKQSGWLSNVDVCSWHQISCDENRTVTGINFGSQFPEERALTPFTGTFPSEIGALTGLKQINLKKMGTEGPIAEFFRKLSKLEELNLWSNSMTGRIPDFFTGEGFPNLITLILSDNKFHGELPTSIGTLSEIREYRVDSNQLSGRIPTEVANMKQIAYFDVGYNRLTGPVPSEIFDLLELRILSLHDNRVSGTLPSTISQLTLLERLKLQGTKFSGKLPSSLYTIPRLREIRLRSCDVEGGIDPSVGNAIYLQIYDVGNTDLAGEIPDVFWQNEFLEELRLDSTGLTGSISEAVCNATGTDFGQIELLHFDCKISHPVDCGNCSNGT